MLLAGFKPVKPALKRLHFYAADRRATGTGTDISPSHLIVKAHFRENNPNLHLITLPSLVGDGVGKRYKTTKHTFHFAQYNYNIVLVTGWAILINDLAIANTRNFPYSLILGGKKIPFFFCKTLPSPAYLWL
jgi:hypothetical protein